MTGDTRKRKKKGKRLYVNKMGKERGTIFSLTEEKIRAVFPSFLSSTVTGDSITRSDRSPQRMGSCGMRLNWRAVS